MGTRGASTPRPSFGMGAARYAVMERRDVRQAVRLEVALVAAFFAVNALVFAGQSATPVLVTVLVLACLGIVLGTWRRLGRRHPHASAYAIGVLIQIAAILQAPTSPIVALTMMGLFPAVVVGASVLLPWRTPWHVAYVAMAASTYAFWLLVLAPIDDTDRLSGLIVGLAAVVTSLTGNALLRRRRDEQWAIERELRTQRVELRATVADLRAARRQIDRLEGILPICAHCKRIRDGDEWRPVEAYVASHSAARFSHGVCPDCLRTHYPGFA
jgi:hypothetical protein